MPLNQLLKNYWDDLYPPLKRINGRLSAFSWLEEELENYLNQNYANKPENQMKPLLESFIQFDDLLGHLSEDAPNFLPIIKQFEQMSFNDEGLEVSESDQVAQSNLQAIENNHLNQLGKISNQQEADDRLSFVFKSLEQLAEYYHENDESILAERLLRLSLWQRIERLPNYDENYQTKVPPPEKDQLTQLTLLIEAENYKGLIDVSDQWLKDNPYWLELHFHLYQAMNYLALKDQAETIKKELLSFVIRFPDLLKLQFANHLPMISATMKTWIDNSLNLEPAEITLNQTKNTSDQNLTENEILLINQLNEIKQKPKSKRLDHLAQLMTFLSSDVAENYKIQLILVLIKALMEQKKLAMLKSYVEVLEEKYHYFHLNQWDKNLAIDVLMVLIKAKKVLKEDITENLAQLSRLDFKKAIELEEIEK